MLVAILASLKHLVRRTLYDLYCPYFEMCPGFSVFCDFCDFSLNSQFSQKSLKSQTGHNTEMVENTSPREGWRF